MALTQPQQTALEAAILAYLSAQGGRFARTAAAMVEEAQFTGGKEVQTESGGEVLEKAWAPFVQNHVFAADTLFNAVGGANMADDRTGTPAAPFPFPRPSAEMKYKADEVIIPKLNCLPDQWTAVVSRFTGNVYFRHDATGQCQRAVPPGFADADPDDYNEDAVHDDGSAAGPWTPAPTNPTVSTEGAMDKSDGSVT